MTDRCMQIAAAAALEQLVQSIVASRKLLIMGTAATDQGDTAGTS
jgi:hypothetical protein